jgi:hypothetical protein
VAHTKEEQGGSMKGRTCAGVAGSGSGSGSPRMHIGGSPQGRRVQRQRVGLGHGVVAMSTGVKAAAREAGAWPGRRGGRMMEEQQ